MSKFKDFRAMNLKARIESDIPDSPYEQEYAEETFKGQEDISRIKNHFQPDKLYPSERASKEDQAELEMK